MRNTLWFLLHKRPCPAWHKTAFSGGGHCGHLTLLTIGLLSGLKIMRIRQCSSDPLHGSNSGGGVGNETSNNEKKTKPKLPALLFPQCFTSYNPVCSFIPLLLGTVQSCCCHLVPYCLMLYSNCNRSCTKT